MAALVINHLYETNALLLKIAMITFATGVFLNIVGNAYRFKRPFRSDVFGQDIAPAEGFPLFMYRLYSLAMWLLFIGLVATCMALVFEKNIKDDAPVLFWTSISIIILNTLIVCFPVLFILMAICCLPCLFIILRWTAPPDNRGASEEIIKRIPFYKYSTCPAKRTYGNATVDEEEATCIICLQDYVEGSEIRVLSCGHHFHKDCADQWFKIQATCPLCVRSISEEYPDITCDVDNMV